MGGGGQKVRKIYSISDGNKYTGGYKEKKWEEK